MANPSSILSPERNRAPAIALAVLCALASAELVLLVRAAWQRHEAAASGTAFTAQPAVEAGPAAPVPAVSSGLSIAPSAATTLPGSPAAALPPLPKLDGSGLPPLPQLDGVPPLPPLPSVGSTLSAPSNAVPMPPHSTSSLTPAPRKLPALPSFSAPPVPSPLPAPTAPAFAQAPLTSPPAPSSPPQPSAPHTGNAAVDELLDVATQSLAMNESDGALQALDRADLILPDNPVIMRQKAIALGKAGQAAKAQAIWDRLGRLGASAGALSTAPRPAPGAGGEMPPPPAGGLNDAFGGAATTTNSGGGPLSLGRCQAIPDPTELKGQKVVLKVPVIASPGAAIDASQMTVDVFFYDSVDGTRVEPTKSDPPTYGFDAPVDFAQGEEVISVVYHMPQLTAAEVAGNGSRSYYGYVVKLYYQNKLLGTAAEPRTLIGGGPAAAPPVGNPLLPPPGR